MANSYTQGTLTPSVKLTDELRTVLGATDASLEPEDDGTTYVYWEEYISESLDPGWNPYDLDQTVLDKWANADMPDILRAVLDHNPGVELLTMEAAMTCSKMRAGEFGGYALYVTRKQYAYVSTNAIDLDPSGNLVSRNRIVEWDDTTAEAQS